MKPTCGGDIMKMTLQVLVEELTERRIRALEKFEQYRQKANRMKYTAQEISAEGKEKWQKLRVEEKAEYYFARADRAEQFAYEIEEAINEMLRSIDPDVTVHLVSTDKMEEIGFEMEEPDFTWSNHAFEMNVWLEHDSPMLVVTMRKTLTNM